MNKQKTLETLLQTIGRLEAQLNASSNNQTTNENGFLKLTEKEISKMPKEFRKTFRLNGSLVHVRKRCTGRYVCSYEIRYARDGYKISASGTTLEIAKQRFLEKVQRVTTEDDCGIVRTPTNFHEFAIYWFENFHKRTAVDKYYSNNLALYHRHIKDKLCNYNLSTISPIQLQRLLDGCPGNGKTADDVYNILKQILACAVNHGTIKLNPLLLCHHERHEPKPGTALSKDEESLLLNTFAGTKYQLYFAVALYTGIRPNEYPSATLDGQFIKAVKSKRHHSKGKVFYKRIPITPMLRPYLEGVSTLTLPREHILEHRFKKLFPEHTLKDMRTTFQTRCSECGIPDNVIGVFMGNSIGKLKDTYTDFSDEYLLKEGEKLLY